MRFLLRSAALLLLFPTGLLTAQLAPDVLAAESDTAAFEMDEEAMKAMYQAYMDSVVETLTFYADTTVTIGDGLADLAVPAGYRFLDKEDAFTVLVDLWGNPPQNGDNSIGMLFPEKYSPADIEGYGIDLFYTEDGYIEDDDAEDMDYDDLLEDLQADTEAGNEIRREQGYQAVSLVGWATPPRYDSENKRLHWAKDLLFEGETDHTLNYNILFLGRKGYLTMNVIGDMKDLPEVNTDLDDFLNSVSYTQGNRYADFDASIDEVAAYGIGALIAGKVLAKTGLLAGIGLFLLKAWKIVAVAGIALVAGLKKMMGKDS